MRGRTALFGVSVTLTSYLGARFVNLAITVILARSLGPEGMGIVAFALLCVEIFDAIRDFGLRETLIYDRSEDPVLRTTAFTMIMCVASFQAGVLLLLAPFAPNLVDDPVIVPVLMWLALVFPLNSLGSAQEAMLQRSYKFGTIAVADIASVCAKALVAITMIYMGYGIWSIVAGVLIGAAVRTATVWIGSDWRPELVRPTWEKTIELYRYGRHLVATGLLSLAYIRADQMVIVSLLGDVALGRYYIAARIPEIVVKGVNGVITKVVFPALSNLSGDRTQLIAAYRTAIGASMTLMAPVALGLAAISGLVVPIVFGEEWSASSPVLMFLAMSGVFTTLGWSTGDYFKATGQPKYLWMLMLAEACFVIPAVLLTAYFTGNIALVAAAMLAGECFSATIRLATLWRVAGVPVTTTLGAAVRPLACAALMAVVVYLYITHNPVGLAPVPLLITAIIVGAATYAPALIYVDRDNVKGWMRSLKADSA